MLRGTALSASLDVTFEPEPREAFGWPYRGNGVAFSLQTVRGGGRAPVSR